MLNALKCLTPSRLPKSTSSTESAQHYFYPKLITLRPTKFKPRAFGNKMVTKAEFNTLRVKMIEAGELPLKHTRRLYYATLGFLTLSLLFWIVRLTLNFTVDSAKIKKIELIMEILFTILPMIFLLCLLAKCLHKAYEYIQCMLEKENVLNYAHKGITWKLSPCLRFLEINEKKNENANLFSGELSTTLRSPYLSTPRTKLTLKTTVDGSAKFRIYLDGNRHISLS